MVILAEANVAKIKEVKDAMTQLENDKVELIIGTSANQHQIIDLMQKVNNLNLEEETLRA